MARSHHDVIERAELLALGYTRAAIAHRLRTGRLFPTRYRGIYGIGRPSLSQKGNWYAAVRSCGDLAALSHGSAAAFWGIGHERGLTELSVPGHVYRSHSGLRIHRRHADLRELFVVADSIQVTSPALTLIDLASYLPDDPLQQAISEADIKSLLRVRTLRDVAAEHSRVPGAARLRDLLDRLTFQMPRSVLERKLLPLADRAGLRGLQTQVRLNGHLVDFFSESLELVIETHGNKFHRSPQKQLSDNRRDQDHVIAGFVPIRFSHYEIAYEAAEVVRRLRAVVERLQAAKRAK